MWRKIIKEFKLVVFLKDVVNEFLTDNCPHLAASISYYSLLSIFPFILALVSVLGFLSTAPVTQERLIEAIDGFLPISSDFITSSVGGAIASRGVIGIIGIIGLLWGGSAVFNAVRKSLNAAWGIKTPRNFFVDRGLELGMMIGAAMLLLASLGLSTALSVVQKYELTVAGIEFLNGDFFWDFGVTIVSIGLAFVTFLFLYKFIPNTRVRWRDVWVGALVGAVGFEVAKQVFVWYTTNFSYYNLIYGPIGTIIALLVWIYVSAIILLFCAKVTSVHSRRRASLSLSRELEKARENLSLPDQGAEKRQEVGNGIQLRGLFARLGSAVNNVRVNHRGNKTKKS